MLFFCRLHTALVVSLMAGAVLAGCERSDPVLVETEERFKAAPTDQAPNAYALESLATTKRMLKMAPKAEPSSKPFHYTYMPRETLDITETAAAQLKAEQEIKDFQNSAVSSLGLAPIPASLLASVQPAERNEKKSDTADILDPIRLDPIEDWADPPHLGTQTSTLSPGDKQWIDPMVERLHSDLKLNVLIEGYGDDTGSHDSNLDISLERAKAIKSYFVEQGIAPTRIETLGRRAQYPIAGNDTAEGRQQDRRIEIVLYRIDRQPESIEQSANPTLGPSAKN
ncbi:MAG: OmpA family protein [Rhodospirillales bacterium]